MQGRCVVCCHVGIELVQVQVLADVSDEKLQGCRTPSTSAEIGMQGYAHLCPLVLGIVGEDIDETHGLTLVHEDKAQLPILIETGRTVQDILFEGETAERGGVAAMRPERFLILYLIEEIDVGEFQGTECEHTV